jgi:hypothetical protein
VTQWEEERAEHVISVELVADGDHTILMLVTRGMPVDLLWAYGAGWHVHLEDLGAYIAGKDREELSTTSKARMDELVPIYRAMDVVAQ